jgi:C-terminal processing protease CtpA/Prc
LRINGTDRAADIRQPVAVLVNGETRAAAEALAGMLREGAAALVIGSKTAGEARLYETFTLSTGQRLRVGKVPIEVGRGKVLPATGMVPDIEVRIGAEAERAYYEDSYLSRRTVAATTGTNGVVDGLNPLNEAELVRRHRAGEDLERSSTAGAGGATGARTAEASVITDPALGRALDFLKGLSIVGPRR